MKLLIEFQIKSNALELYIQKKETVVGQIRTMSYSIIDTIHIRGLQNLDKSIKLNPIEIKINGNQILQFATLPKRTVNFVTY